MINYKSVQLLTINQEPMPVDKLLVERLKNTLIMHQIDFEEKRMFGGNFFMVDQKMCIGVFRDGIMARLGPDKIEEMTEKYESASQLIHPSGKKMTGFALIEAEGYETDEALEFWVLQCLAFNPFAKSTKK